MRPRWLQLFLAVVAIALAAAFLAVALPGLGVSSYLRTLVYYTAFYLALGQAWNLMSGLTGYVSFAHGALAGIGAYAAVMALNADWSIAAALVLAALATMLISLVIGVTSLRLRGVSFTFATLFFQQLALLVLRKLPASGGPGGLALEDILPVWLPEALMLALAALATIVMLLLRHSRLGLRLLAIKGDEDAAVAVGIAATRLKLGVFCASAAIAALAGAIHGLFTASLYPDVVFSVDMSLVALAVPVIGGVATTLGPVVGAIFYVGLGELLQIYAPGLHLTVIGLLLIGIVLFLPAGLGPGLAAALSGPRAARLKPVREG